MARWCRLSIHKNEYPEKVFPWCKNHLLNLFRIYGYAATWTADAVFIFGGYYSKSQAVIAKYSNDEWSNEGSLIQGRYSHAAISHNGVTLIIGGSTDDGKP